MDCRVEQARYPLAVASKEFRREEVDTVLNEKSMNSGLNPTYFRFLQLVWFSL